MKTSKLANNAVTGAKAKEETFEGLIQGEGELYTRSFIVDGVGFLPDPKPVIAEVPTMASSSCWAASARRTTRSGSACSRSTIHRRSSVSGP